MGRRWALSGLGVLAVLVLAVLVSPRQGHGRLQPYYILRNTSAAEALVPRVLVVLDTSETMAHRAEAGAGACTWGQCEDPALADTTSESRMAAARRAVHSIVNGMGDQAKFALMSFERNDPPKTQNPDKCSFIMPKVGVQTTCCNERQNQNGCDNATCQNAVCTAMPSCCTSGWTAACVQKALTSCSSICQQENTRFSWSSSYTSSQGGGATIGDAWPGQIGTWHLCQGTRTRPYPYLRWDDLGAGSVIAANNAGANPLPASPLIAAAQIRSATNARRKVQWFPQFVGVRFQPNATTDPNQAITQLTVGDYGTTNATRTANVWQQDFYYWPYVDGFPGYSEFLLAPSYGGEMLGGVASQDNQVNEGKLWAPFYLDLSNTQVNPNFTGPASVEAARSLVLAHTDLMTRGGIGPGGNTPWSSTVGSMPAAPPNSNGVFSHVTVASYLKFVKNIATPDVCAPMAAILITDGTPDANEGGAQLYRRIAALRKELGVQVYVVGFFMNGGPVLNEMACAGAGACDTQQCSTPCSDTPAKAWDTCANSDDPANGCAYLASSAVELQDVLTQIINKVGDFDVPSGPGAAINEFSGDSGGAAGESTPFQTTLEARTEYPSWRGHVMRAPCEDTDDNGQLLEHCVLPNPEFEPDEVEETFGPCPQSRAWDAGECLQLTACGDRRLYTNTLTNDVIPINDGEEASGQFVGELQTMGVVNGPSSQEQADAIVRFVLGCDAPEGWKLPGLANSAPIIVRRVPPYRTEFSPSVNVRDPHCGGRLISSSDGPPQSLEEFATETWDENNLVPNPSPHFAYQEAVLIGDDMGVLHAFQLDSGNELFGFVPRPALSGLAQQAANGPELFGQPTELEDHIYGLAATLNHALVFDEANDKWRDVAVIGMGAGGTHLTVLDVSHMSPVIPEGPIEVLWTTESPQQAADAALYAQYNGETWARPAIIYHVPNDESNQEPDAFVVFGTGYQPGAGFDPETHDASLVRGRVIVRAEALTGNIVETATLPHPTHALYETAFGSVVDPAVGTHCRSRLWAEAQETYIADPAGRLFRWDLGRTTSHESDSGGPWGNGPAQAVVPFFFPACVGGPPCTVSGNNPGDPFLFTPAATSDDRLDDFFSSAPIAGPADETDRFLIALISGSPADDSLPFSTGFTPSIYLLADDHSGDKTTGFSIPAGAPLVAPGANPSYMRIAITQVERTRVVVPYNGAPQITETRNFSRATRPIRPPRIFVTGVVEEPDPNDPNAQTNPNVIDGVEVYFIEYTVYEPPSGACDPAWYDTANEHWVQDPGSSYVLTFRLTHNTGTGFSFSSGGGASGGAADFGQGFETGLTLQSVEQLDAGGNCADGQCGPQIGTAGSAPCDLNVDAPPSSRSTFALTVQRSELAGFTPVE